MNLNDYKQTNNYKDLIKKHSINEYGIWWIEGEDPNCDYMGPHDCPTLGFVESTLADAITYAVMLPKFYTYGYGGTITKIDIIKLPLYGMKQ